MKFDHSILPPSLLVQKPDGQEVETEATALSFAPPSEKSPFSFASGSPFDTVGRRNPATFVSPIAPEQGGTDAEPVPLDLHVDGQVLLA